MKTLTKTDSFEQKLIDMQDNMKYFAFSLTGNHESAEDLVQDTFVKALTNKRKFEEGTNLKSWVFTILKNTFINEYHRAKRIQFESTQPDEESGSSLLDLSVAEHNADADIYMDEIQNAISAIPEDHRIPFEMVNAGYKYQEISEQLNVPLGTVKSRIFLCRRTLMENLQDFRN